ncbi:TPA: KTSC domain-containing protein [Klebsiella oxytoca]|nr:KTSC domain-containing protein [Klebsiella oxytoca]EKU2383948.1 KTSC domain-containing protein [Klebsiella oxytoca]ELQ9025545.1 KTSC domain-containing protein [Klebsiella oxytoca]MBX4771459.1 KTSC domain-containing protein [Klebsiella oxytoca]MCW9485337.1 KTSC domain-containing protein [Klebsiella oxytoca]HBC7471551.1 KTSC domain-containing protein [Klebsiella oxytoca]
MKVSGKTHNDFLMAKSKGRFFEGVIKGKYLCRKIG